LTIGRRLRYLLDDFSLCRRLNRVLSWGQLGKKQWAVGNALKDGLPSAVSDFNIGAAEVIPALQRKTQLEVIAVCDSTKLIALFVSETTAYVRNVVVLLHLKP